MITLLLVRHGSTDWVGERLQGWVSIDLNRQGEHQASVLAQNLSGLPIAAIYSSPLLRARRTAQIIAKEFGIEVVTLDGLGDIRTGQWAGKSYAELDGENLWQSILSRPSIGRYPGGESLFDVQVRAVKTMSSILEGHRTGMLMAVTHADVIRALVSHYLGIPLDVSKRIDIGPASLTKLKFPSNPPSECVLECISCGDVLPLHAKLHDTGTYDGDRT